MDFLLDGNRLTGSIPSTLFTNMKRYPSSIIFDNNVLTGTIPSDLFTGLSWDSTSVEISFAGNQLTGTLPANIFGTNFWGTTQHSYVSLNLASNKLSGTIPQTLFSATVGMSKVTLSLNNNAFTGSIPDFFANVSALRQIDYINIGLGGNKLSGTILASKLWPPSSVNTLGIAWKLYANALTGSIPENLLSGANESMAAITIDLSDNKLTGSILPSMLSNVHFTDPISLSLYFRNNSLTGPLSSELIAAGGQLAAYLTLDLSFNPLGGTIPGDLFSSFTTQRTDQLVLQIGGCGLSGTLPSVTSKIRLLYFQAANNELSAVPVSWTSWLTSALVDTTLTLDLSNNKLTGALALPSLDGDYSRIQLFVDGNDLTSLEFGAQSSYFDALSVAMNPQMTGTIPASFFSPTSRTSYLNANGTLISGDLAVVSGSKNSYLDSLFLSNTSINFCPETLTSPWAASGMSNCELKNVNVTCIDKYPAVCQYYYGRVVEPYDPEPEPEPESQPEQPESTPGPLRRLYLHLRLRQHRCQRPDRCPSPPPRRPQLLPLLHSLR